jgi:hypothetical protein
MYVEVWWLDMWLNSVLLNWYLYYHSGYLWVTDRSCRAMAQAISCRPLTAEVGIRTRVGPCGISGGQSFFSEFFTFPLSISFHHCCPYTHIAWGMNNWPISGRSSETSSHCMDMNNISLGVSLLAVLWSASIVIAYFCKCGMKGKQAHNPCCWCQQTC